MNTSLVVSTGLVKVDLKFKRLLIKLSDNVAPVNCFTTSWKRAAASARSPENWRSFSTDFFDKDLSDILA
ncbi:hypothetical protein T4A_11562 [Trichinella pseudospiralis]|uniref:Uncharacterized protein n=1 Tax=Trichinella pseudospiralis TaxID=6337 RepID=A0A0V1EQH4_TRIPS|nr:hypothetical protein T4E_1559 [Trichinella pseudospiralis]KRY76025.1 hypothetical protein T4A_11562 [Trichinella pseudospiralis]KRY89946.1 hypothetical protein T4D_16090 [Trichinella pseudospiralis]KRZ40626.1 hypothetical protein T4C_1551 [Trichinella pseudospiralis]